MAVQVLGSSSSFAGTGQARLHFQGSSSVIEVTARYAPNSHINVCSSDILAYKGCKIEHSPFNASLTLPSGERLSMDKTLGISCLFLSSPINQQQNHQELDQEIVLSTMTENQSDLWHKRLMHLGKEKLNDLKIKVDDWNSNCTTCYDTKNVFKQMILNKDFKSRAEKLGDLIVLDILVPQQSVEGYMMLVMDVHSRFLFGKFWKKASRKP